MLTEHQRLTTGSLKEVNEISKITNKCEIRCESRYGQHEDNDPI